MAGSPGDGRRPQPSVITNARSGTSKDLATRQRQYMIAMGIRTICFLASTILYFTHVINIWVCVILYVAAVFLPSVAVAIANQANTKTQDQQKFEHGEPNDRHQLTTGPEPEVISGVVEDEYGPVPTEDQRDEQTDGRFDQRADGRYDQHVDDRGAA